ncbi:hypothetical protein ACQW02_25425 [Humitalea sp. 24SJ18S-53]|uniref:hypothetical protein n=1 Tax=Humitalea sp. 24SJ18S-53 TaxID=3422307 RepID=UPI003D671707
MARIDTKGLHLGCEHLALGLGALRAGRDGLHLRFMDAGGLGQGGGIAAGGKLRDLCPAGRLGRAGFQTRPGDAHPQRGAAGQQQRPNGKVEAPADHGRAPSAIMRSRHCAMEAT